MRWGLLLAGAAAAHEGPHGPQFLEELVTPYGVVSIVETELGESLAVDGRVARLPQARRVSVLALVTADGAAAALVLLSDRSPCGLRHALVRLDDLHVAGPFGACGARYLGGGPEGAGWQMTVGADNFVYDGDAVRLRPPPPEPAPPPAKRPPR